MVDFKFVYVIYSFWVSLGYIQGVPMVGIWDRF